VSEGSIPEQADTTSKTVLSELPVKVVVKGEGKKKGVCVPLSGSMPLSGSYFIFDINYSNYAIYIILCKQPLILF